MQIKLISFPVDQMAREVSANLNAVRECLHAFATLLLSKFMKLSPFISLQSNVSIIYI